MKLEADMQGHYAALHVPDATWIDAGRSGDLAGLELGVSPELIDWRREERS